MQCETCGKDVKTGKKVKLEGSIVFTCDECAKYGKIVSEVKVVEPAKKPVAQKAKPASAIASGEVFEETLNEDFNNIIKKAREKMGWKHEDLAKKINEPMSLIHRLETDPHFDPSNELIRKLQKTLHIRLMEKTKAVNLDGIKTGFKNNSKELTLGDVVVVKKRK